MSRSRTDLVAVLVAQSNTAAMYVQDAQFRATLDSLAAMLPSMVQGLAEECTASATVREQVRRDIDLGLLSGGLGSPHA